MRYPAIHVKASSGVPWRYCERLFWNAFDSVELSVTSFFDFAVYAAIKASACAVGPASTERDPNASGPVAFEPQPARRVPPAAIPKPPTAAPLSTERREMPLFSSDIEFHFSRDETYEKSSGGEGVRTR